MVSPLWRRGSARWIKISNYGLSIQIYPCFYTLWLYGHWCVRELFDFPLEIILFGFSSRLISQKLKIHLLDTKHPNGYNSSTGLTLLCLVAQSVRCLDNNNKKKKHAGQINVLQWYILCVQIAIVIYISSLLLSRREKMQRPIKLCLKK